MILENSRSCVFVCHSGLRTCSENPIWLLTWKSLPAYNNDVVAGNRHLCYQKKAQHCSASSLHFQKVGDRHLSRVLKEDSILFGILLTLSKNIYNNFHSECVLPRPIYEMN